MRYPLISLLIFIAAAFGAFVEGAAGMTCPELSLIIEQPAQTRTCIGQSMNVCARAVEYAGECNGEAFHFDKKEWSWEVTGVTASPQSGYGSCARFIPTSAGLGTVVFNVRAMASKCETCEKSYSTAHAFRVEHTKLTLSKEWLGIDLTDEHRTDTLTAFLESSSSVTWKLEGEAQTVFDFGAPGSGVVVKETGRPSSTLSGEVVRVISPLLCSDAKRFTVVKLDILAGIAEEKEEEPGLIFGLNDNDSDESGAPDHTEAPLLAEDPDLIPITFKIWPSNLPDDQVIGLTGVEHCYEDRRKMTNAAASYTVARVRAGLTLYLEGAVPGVHTLTAQHPQSEARDKLEYTVLKATLTPDWNHNRRIDDEDANQVSTNNPFRFWINDDADSGDVSEGDSDVPGQGGKANHKNSKIDGRSDLTDFFPVWLDIGQILSQVSEDVMIECYLKQADDALNAVYTDLSKGNAGDFLIVDSKSYGPSFDKDSHSAPVFKVTAGGVKLSEEFVNKMKSDPNKGVLLFEGRATTQNPLILEVRLDGKVITEARLPMSIDGVEKMYRWVNLRGFTDPGMLSAPTNYPDDLCNEKNFVFVHGYNVSETSARGWSAEIFKRMYWSGSRAKFHAITWSGNSGQVHIPGLGDITPDYHVNVINAFETAPHLASYISRLHDNSIIAAHSLGNMVVSAAIQDVGMPYAKYCMINAAVSIESYDGNSSSQSIDMIHAEWGEYIKQTRLFSGNWHTNFPFSDARSELAWKWRFGRIGTNAYNFYSSREDTLATHPHSNSPGLLDVGIFSPVKEFAWALQEKLKGRMWVSWIGGGSTVGGWGFNADYRTGVFDLLGDSTLYAASSPESAASLPNHLFTIHPYFDPGTRDMKKLYSLDGDVASLYAKSHRNKLLATFIPALSLPAGGNEIPLLSQPMQYPQNINMQYLDIDRPGLQNGWPQTRINKEALGRRWLHSDLKDVAYCYVYKLYEKLFILGDIGEK